MIVRVLITDYVHPVLEQRLASLDIQVDYLPNISYKGFLAVVNNYDGVIINSKIKMDAAALTKGSKLQFIGRLGSGLDIIDLPFAKAKNVKILSTPGGNKNAVAEHAVGMLLCLKNHLHLANHSVKAGNWEREKHRGSEMIGQTIGIIGFGNNGSAFAEKWANWGVRVLAYDKYKKDYAHAYDWVEEVSLEELQAASDIISLHVPLTEETHHMVDHDFIHACANDFILINTSRGKVVSLDALLEGLERKKITGACLDVLENEKPDSYTAEEKLAYSRLYHADNVILSPHIAGWTKESLHNIASVMADKIENLGLSRL